MERILEVFSEEIPDLIDRYGDLPAMVSVYGDDKSAQVPLVDPMSDLLRLAESRHTNPVGVSAAFVQYRSTSYITAFEIDPVDDPASVRSVFVVIGKMGNPTTHWFVRDWGIDETGRFVWLNAWSEVPAPNTVAPRTAPPS